MNIVIPDQINLTQRARGYYDWQDLHYICHRRMPHRPTRLARSLSRPDKPTGPDFSASVLGALSQSPSENEQNIMDDKTPPRIDQPWIIMYGWFARLVLSRPLRRTHFVKLLSAFQGGQMIDQGRPREATFRHCLRWEDCGDEWVAHAGH